MGWLGLACETNRNFGPAKILRVRGRGSGLGTRIGDPNSWKKKIIVLKFCSTRGIMVWTQIMTQICVRMSQPEHRSLSVSRMGKVIRTGAGWVWLARLACSLLNCLDLPRVSKWHSKALKSVSQDRNRYFAVHLLITGGHYLCHCVNLWRLSHSGI